MDFDRLEISDLRRRRGEKWRTYPDDVLPAWVADMDFMPAPPVARYLAEVLEVGDIGYCVNPTANCLPRVFAERMQRRYGWTVDPQQIDVITDVVQGMYIALEVFSSPGQAAITPTPIYPPFLAAIRETGRRAVHVPVVRGRDGRFEFDFDRLEGAVDAETRLLLLCNPHNPTGRVLTRAELERFAEIALAHDLVVVSDEIHSDLIFAGATHVPFAALSPEIEARTVTLTSATKAFNIAGLRCAVAAFGSAELQKRFDSVPRHVRGGLGTLGLEATRIAWEECDGWREELVDYLAANRDFLADYVARHWPAVVHTPPEATYLAWLDCRELALPDDPYRFFLREAKVALSRGPSFGPGGEGHVRINFATSRAILTQILERMDTAIRATHAR